MSAGAAPWVLPWIAFFAAWMLLCCAALALHRLTARHFAALPAAERSALLLALAMLPVTVAALVALLGFTPSLGGVLVDHHCHAGQGCGAHVPILYAGAPYALTVGAVAVRHDARALRQSASPATAHTARRRRARPVGGAGAVRTLPHDRQPRALRLLHRPVATESRDLEGAREDTIERGAQSRCGTRAGARGAARQLAARFRRARSASPRTARPPRVARGPHPRQRAGLRPRCHRAHGEQCRLARCVRNDTAGRAHARDSRDGFRRARPHSRAGSRPSSAAASRRTRTMRCQRPSLARTPQPLS